MKKSLSIAAFIFLISTSLFSQKVVEMEYDNGVYYVPCKINDIPMKFIFDTGASNVSISMTEAIFLLKQGALKEEDLKESVKYQIANGEVQEGTKIIIRKIDIDGIILEDVEAGIVHELNAPLLLGQSAISKLGKIELDGNRLIIHSADSEKEYSNYTHIIKSKKEFLEKKTKAENGNADEQYDLAMHYQTQTDTLDNHKKAYYWYVESAKQGHKMSLFNLVNKYYEGIGTEVDKEKGFKILQLLSKNTNEGTFFNGVILYTLAQKYELGDGTLKDETKSFELYKKSAENGFAMAQRVLYYTYLEGSFGIEKNDKNALVWLKKCAENGNVLCQKEIGALYNQGTMVTKDQKKAFYWFKKSAEQGDSDTQLELGLMYYQGDITLKDEKRAFYWFKKSAEQGNSIAQYNIGLWYYDGIGVLANKSKSAFWIKKSFENGYEEAKEFWDYHQLWKYDN